MNTRSRILSVSGIKSVIDLLGISAERNATLKSKRDSPGFDEMNGAKLQSMFLVAQFLTIFVATATVLGRVYFISYHEFIGIPLIEDPSNVLGYAIISPDLAIASIGIILIVLSYLYFRRQILTLVDRTEKPLVSGVLLLVIGAFVFFVGTFPSLDDFEIFADRRLSKGLEGILVIMGFGSLHAGIFFYSQLEPRPTNCGKEARTTTRTTNGRD